MNETIFPSKKKLSQSQMSTFKVHQKKELRKYLAIQECVKKEQKPLSLFSFLTLNIQPKEKCLKLDFWTSTDIQFAVRPQKKHDINLQTETISK